VKPGKRGTRSICTILSALTLSSMAVTAVLAIPAQAVGRSAQTAAACADTPTSGGPTTSSSTATASATPTATLTPCPPTDIPTASPTSSSPTATPSQTPTGTPTQTPTGTPTQTTTSAPPTDSGPPVITLPTGGLTPPGTLSATPISPSRTAPPTTAPVATTVSPTSGGGGYPYSTVPPGDSPTRLPHGTISQAQVIERAQRWVAEKVPYSEDAWWTDADGEYRQDCSGYVSMAWGLNQDIDFWTGNLNTVSHTIPAADLEPGDILLSNQHTVLFAGWADAAHTMFDFYEESHPGTVAHYVIDAPLAAYLGSGFAPFRYDGLHDSAVSQMPPTPAEGMTYASLMAGGSELVPLGSSTVEPPAAPWQSDGPSTAPAAAPATHLPPVATVAEDEPLGGTPIMLMASAAGLAFLLAGAMMARRSQRGMPSRYSRRH
jgi:hypothetical protein